MGVAVEHRPGRASRHNHFACRIAEIDPAIGLGAFGRAINPGLSGHAFARRDITAIIDLVPDHDPEVLRIVFWPCSGVPMRGGDILHPLHPDSVVDMPELINVLG